MMDTGYRRYDSPYIQAERKDSTLEFRFKGETLYLDFARAIREF